MKGYKVELTIDEDVLKDIEQEMLMKRITGSLFGIHDEFLLLILKGWKEGRARLHVTRKKEGEKPIEVTLGRRKSIGSKQTKGWMKVIKESSANDRTKKKTS